MERLNVMKIALTAISLFTTTTIWAQTSDVDSMRHSKLDDTQLLKEVVVKSSLPNPHCSG